MIGRDGGRGSGISVLAARHDDDSNWKIYFSPECNIKLLFQTSCLWFIPKIRLKRKKKKGGTRKRRKMSYKKEKGMRKRRQHFYLPLLFSEHPLEPLETR